MEWIRISSNKLKIMLSSEDARRYELNCEDADYANVMTRAAFRDILTDVRRETGFDATEDKVYIQMYPSKEGGCELFVTKIGLLLTEEESYAASTEQHTAEHHAVSEMRTYYIFDSLPPLLSLCRRLQDHSEIRKSTVWKDERGGWWLLLCTAGGRGALHALMREYAKEVQSEKAALYLGEHAERICDRAVQLLGHC